MAGLLDLFSGDAGLLTGLALMDAGSAKPVRTSTAGGLLSALTNTQQVMQSQEDRKQRQKMQALQEQQILQALAAQKAQQEQAQTRQKYLGSIDPMQGPALPVSMAGGMAAGLAPQEVAALMPPQQKAPEYKVVNGSLVKIAGDNVSEAFRAPEKPDLNSLIVPGPDGKPVLNQMLLDAKRQIAAEGAARVQQSVNTGQKGFDNTLKLRGDFRSEPIYKAHQEMQSAYSQIQQSLKQSSPAGDLAAATKIMKLLDPGSVVRESELGMAMAATGLMDRVSSYADNILKGTKLTPTQRKDFQTLADALYGESVKQFNSKRGEYQGIAERNQLSVMDVLGPESSAPNSAGGWSIKPKGQ